MSAVWWWICVVWVLTGVFVAWDVVLRDSMGLWDARGFPGLSILTLLVVVLWPLVFVVRRFNF